MKAWRSGEKDKPTIEYLILKELITRWRKAAKNWPPHMKILYMITAAMKNICHEMIAVAYRH